MKMNPGRYMNSNNDDSANGVGSAEIPTRLQHEDGSFAVSNSSSSAEIPTRLQHKDGSFAIDVKQEIQQKDRPLAVLSNADGGKIPARSEINSEYKWKLEDMFDSDTDWEKECDDLKKSLNSISSFRNRLSESAETLRNCLAAQDDISARCEAVYAYARMRRDEDNNNDKYQAFTSIAMSLYAETMAVTAFIAPEILSIKKEVLDVFIEDVHLSGYRHFLNDIQRQRAHILSEREEEMLAMASDPLNASVDIYTKFSNADLKFPDVINDKGEPVELSEGRYVRLLESFNRSVRENTFTALYSTYESFKNTIAASLSSSVKKDHFISSVRHYNSTIEAQLDSDMIPVSVYDNLVETVNQNLSLLHRYIRLRKKALKLDTLHMYDLYVPIAAPTDLHVSYEDATRLITEGLAPLGDKYAKDLLTALKSGWVDVYENIGKTRGAYSWGAYRTHPYMLLNYQNTIDDVLTLAHEIGHSMHTYYTNLSQPYIYSNYDIFVAEVASTVNETLLINHLISNAHDDMERVYLLNRQLETFRGTLFRQTMFAEFERAIHEKVNSGDALTPEVFSMLYKALNEKYFADEVIVDQHIALEWARIPHFYNAFYVYKYATGISAATSLARQITDEGAPAVERYMGFLSSGASDYPLELLRRAGVDLSTPTPILKALEVFRDTLDALEVLI